MIINYSNLIVYYDVGYYNVGKLVKWSIIFHWNDDIWLKNQSILLYLKSIEMWGVVNLFGPLLETTINITWCRNNTIMLSIMLIVV